MLEKSSCQHIYTYVNIIKLVLPSVVRKGNNMETKLTNHHVMRMRHGVRRNFVSCVWGSHKIQECSKMSSLQVIINVIDDLN